MIYNSDHVLHANFIYMTSTEIRQSFFDFFQSKQHRIVQSAPVVPHDDPTLLFTNAGMNQFKDVFLAQGKRDYARAADTQKCIRVSGKHNDLEEVGRDTYHHTFFEMLGNWSFGDYYKREAIMWAWELLTSVWKLPKDRLHATVFRDDDEAHVLWTEVTDIIPSHVHRFDEKDNFWEMGETGPCGPCSEIHIDLTPDGSGAALVNAGVPEVMEIWNLVFIQYNRDESGVLSELPAKHVDTGMGFERVCAVLQGKKSNYDTDVFTPIIERIEAVTGKPYEGEVFQVAMRVVADHVRMLAFAIADGAMPGNEGRGYVLRRILRRASRFGRNFGMHEPFIWKIVETLAHTMGDVFPEIISQKALIERVIRAEEESFNATLDRGLEIFEDIIATLKKSSQTTMPGEDAFKLYDTFGFPIDLTTLLAKERGYAVDQARFEELLEQQKERSRAATKSRIMVTGAKDAQIELEVNPRTSVEPQFAGYDALEIETEVLGIQRGDRLTYVVLDRTPFYTEAGGQVSDTGWLNGAEVRYEVAGMMKDESNSIHVVQGHAGFEPGQEVRAIVDRRRRNAIMRNHTATHLLHAALRNILGTHVQQAGSLVAPDHLRFDFSHFSKVNEEELIDIEAQVNEKIMEMIPIQHHRGLPFDEARKMGALMFFGDKYGDTVNVVQVGEYSKEFCGGTHVRNTSEIGLFKILHESSIASGTRRIEAVTAEGVAKYILELHRKLDEQEQASETLHETIHRLEKELSRYTLQSAESEIEKLVAGARMWNDSRIVVARMSASDAEQLKSIGDVLREKLKSGVGLLAAEIEGKVSLVCVVTDDLIKEHGIKAGEIVGVIAKRLGGGGGGRPHLATAGAKDVSGLDDVLKDAVEIITRSAQ